jgi:hypothetical protein
MLKLVFEKCFSILYTKKTPHLQNLGYYPLVNKKGNMKMISAFKAHTNKYYEEIKQICVKQTTSI